MGTRTVRLRKTALLAVMAAAVVVTVTACTTSGTHASSATPSVRHSPVPTPKPATFVPKGYRVTKIWQAPLSGPSGHDVIVYSQAVVKQTSDLRPGDLQILHFDPASKVWSVAWDGQDAFPPGDSGSSAALFDPTMNDTVDFLTVAPVLPGTTPQVVFTVNANAFGSGCACALGVVGLSDGQGDLDYYWSGDWGASNVQVKKHLLSATASYWTPSDPHGSPVRTYDFSVRVTAPGVYTTVKDTRPWLGVYVRATRSLDPSSPVTVVQVVPDSPAAAYLRPGDVLVSIQNAPTGSQGGGLGPDIYDQLARFLPGQTAHVLLRRGASLKAVDVRLGSMADVSARNLPSAPDGVDVL